MSHTPENLLVVTRVLYSFIFFSCQGHGFSVPVMYQMFQQIKLHDVASFPLEIDGFHDIIPDTKLYIGCFASVLCTNGSNSNYNCFTSQYVGRGHYALDPTIKDKSVHFPILQMLWALDHACAEISIATDVSRTYLLEQFTCHDYVVRTIENWCRHLDCRVIQCMLPKLSDLVGDELSPIKKGKTSQHQVHYNSARAIMVSSLH